MTQQEEKNDVCFLFPHISITFNDMVDFVNPDRQKRIQRIQKVQEVHLLS